MTAERKAMTLDSIVAAAAKACSKHAYGYWRGGSNGSFEALRYYDEGLPNKPDHEAPYADIIRKAIDAALSRAAVAWEYYYRVDECHAESAHNPDCICWHPEGSGPFKDAKHGESSPILGWRRAIHSSRPARDGAA